ncbi:MAG: CRISPR-associated endonuclease Cas2 [Pseudomonadota bacterium]
MADKKLYVISYDIVDNRKRAKAAETLKDYGRRVQKSVFECRLEAKFLADLLIKLKEIIDDNVDNVLVYMLCEACVKQKKSMGLQIIEKTEDFCVL